MLTQQCNLHIFRMGKIGIVLYGVEHCMLFIVVAVLFRIADLVEEVLRPKSYA